MPPRLHPGGAKNARFRTDTKEFGLKRVHWELSCAGERAGAGSLPSQWGTPSLRNLSALRPSASAPPSSIELGTVLLFGMEALSFSCFAADQMIEDATETEQVAVMIDGFRLGLIG
jgi:hypothetical protein